jgi:hypothetical protein
MGNLGRNRDGAGDFRGIRSPEPTGKRRLYGAEKGQVIELMGLELVVLWLAAVVGGSFQQSINAKKARKEAQKFEVPEIYGSESGYATDEECERGGLL